MCRKLLIISLILQYANSYLMWISSTFLLTYASLPQRGRLVEPLGCDWEKRLHQWAAPMEEVSPLPLVDSPLPSPPGHIPAMAPTPAPAPPSCLLKLTFTTRLTGVSRASETLRPSPWRRSSTLGGVLCFVHEHVLSSRLLLNCT